MGGLVYTIQALRQSQKVRCARCEDPKPIATFLAISAIADAGGRREHRQPVCRACAQEISDHYGAPMPGSTRE